MHAASQAIHAAQSSAHPLDDLRKARRELNFAKENKGGHRVAALKLVDGAIADLEAGKRIDADRKIKEAITEIEKGIALHPRDKR